MKPIKCEVHEPCVGGTKTTCHASIRKALKYCKLNGISRQLIYVRDGCVITPVFGSDFPRLSF